MKEQKIVGEALSGFDRDSDNQPGPVLTLRQQRQRKGRRRALQAGQARPALLATQGVLHGLEKLIP